MLSNNECEIVATFNGKVIGTLQSITYKVDRNVEYQLSVDDNSEDEDDE